MPGERARSVLPTGPGARFADVRWVAETGSTNADLMALARRGDPEGIVLVADHQTAGRGRAGRSWSAPAGAGLLVSILLRPPAAAVEACTMVVALAAAEATMAVAGFSPRLKWPNDLVWPGDGSGRDRKLAGILAEADWPAGASDHVAVVVGIGVNIRWPADVPADLADIAIACTEVSDVAVDREDLLIALLEALGPRYAALVAGDRAALLDEWRACSATLGRQVRVVTGDEEVEGTAVDVDADGHLLVDTRQGERRTFAVGDVVHLRATEP